jgi:formate dehydrogenase major subunit
VPGLGNSFGRGGATTFPPDLKNSDSILVMGSNMAECHPVAFRWVMQAKTRWPNPATIISVDPRFTRTSAMANIYAPLRSGSDIVFLGSIIKYIMDRHEPIFEKARSKEPLSPREQFFHDYIVHYTNAASIITDEFKDTEDLAGLFAGYDPETRKYDNKKWRYETAAREGGNPPGDGKPSFSEIVGKLVGPPAKQDLSLQHERCVWQILKKHFQRYTPQMVEDVCGTPRDAFFKVADALLANAGPDRTGAMCYALGWTQHTVGVQMIRCAAMIQLLLGNIGRPGGGIMALRGHATIQGSTDIATLNDLLPGYLNAPDARKKHDTLRDYIKTETSATSWWSNFPKYIVSQLKAWYGDAAKPENDYCYEYLPKRIDDHSHIPMFVAMHDGIIKGFMCVGQNPAGSGQHSIYHREALGKLDWLVVRDLYETETASFWRNSPEIASGKIKPQDIKTEVILLPAAGVAETDGSFTNTQRMLQWHEKAADPPDDARSDVWFTYHLGQMLKNLYADSKEARDRAIQAMTWEYMDEKANAQWHINDEPSTERILKEVHGYYTAGENKGKLVGSFVDLKDDGSTACGAWIYSGVFGPPTKEHPEGINRAANRQSDEWVSLNWGWAWPVNRRIIYNRCSADPQGQPWAKEARLAKQYGRAAGFPQARGYVYWDAAQKKWTGLDVPDFPTTKPPGTAAKPDGIGIETHDGASPFIMKADGKGWLFAPVGLLDGPIPTHFEPYESPVANLLYKNHQNNPVMLMWNIKENPHAVYAFASKENQDAQYNSEKYPHVVTTYRLTEHHTTGAMSRNLPWLAELQPEMFAEISPEHAEELQVRNTEWLEISTPRGTIRAKALITRRLRPLQLRERKVHHVGLPMHWGYDGLPGSTGGICNDLCALVADPNVTIHEAKAFLCQVRKV